MPYPPSSEPTSSAASPVVAELVPPMRVPSYGEGGSFAVLSKTTILSATPPAVLDAIRRTREWEQWNSFCPRCVVSAPSGEKVNGKGDEEGEGILEVGCDVVIEVFMEGDGLVEGRKKSRDTTVRVTVVDEDFDGPDWKGCRIAWKLTGWAQWQLRSERVVEMRVVPGGTEVWCWETFGGVLAPVVKAKVASALVERFGDWARDLKGFVESRGKR